MTPKKILLLGYFGFKTNQKDGQTIKTRQCYTLIERRAGDGVSLRFFDTEILHFYPWKILGLLWKTVCADKVVYLPAHNNLRYFFPSLYVLSKIFRFDIIYIQIGGWLPEFFDRHPFINKKMRKIKVLLLENQKLNEILLQRYGMLNVEVMPNFRFVNFKPALSSQNRDRFRLVFMSRIIKKKGIDVVFALAEYFARPEIKAQCPVEIDFYGKTYPEDETYFLKALEQYADVHFKGEIEPERIPQTLSGYDALILPTRYTTEGVPGAIIDAYTAGIPVLVSNWFYADSCVTEDETGYIVPIGKDEVAQYAAHIEYLFTHQDKLDRMKKMAYSRSKIYGEESAWKTLEPFLK